MEEVDFTLEADNLEVFAAFLKAENLENEATCPKVYRHASSKKVSLHCLIRTLCVRYYQL